jgi:hypothetical protein
MKVAKGGWHVLDQKELTQQLESRSRTLADANAEGFVLREELLRKN